MEANKYPQDLVLEGYGVKLKRLTHDNQFLASIIRVGVPQKNKYFVAAT